MIEIGVDIGGTFVDVVCLRDRREISQVKVSTTSRDLVTGVRNGIERLLDMTGIEPSDITRVVHGSTVATNAIIEGKASPIGVLMTDGFEDTLEIGRQKRSRMYDLFHDSETPTFLAPRRMRRGVRERIDPKGQVVVSLHEDDVVRAARELGDRYGTRAFAVCYLFSFCDPVHELRTRDLLKEIDPDFHVSLSYEVDPTFREYERLCLTAFDAYLKPVVGSYLVDLENSISELGIKTPMQVMQSRGAIITSENAVRRPVSMFLSGPAAGVIGGTISAAASGFSDAITMDMGGTSNDVSIIRAGQPLASSENKILAYPVRIPMVDVSAIGAGGGSIAWVDSGGVLKVGPHSAGADPGPACYGRGGIDPTVTDANIVLGYLPRQLGGGTISLDAELSERAISALGQRIGFDAVTTASGIQRIVNANMAEQIRLMTVKRGYDARKFGLVVLGGGGPMHGVEVARMLGITRVIVPQTPGVLSAFGLLVANVQHHHARSIPMRVEEADLDQLAAVRAELNDQGSQLMRLEGVPPDSIEMTTLVELRYVGQSYELEVPLRGGADAAGLQNLVEDFHALHHSVYGYANRDQAVEILTLRVVHSSAIEAPKIIATANGQSFEAAQIEARKMWWPELGWIDTPVFDKDHIPLNTSRPGPAVVQQSDTTILIPRDCHFAMDPSGNLIIQLPGVER